MADEENLAKLKQGVTEWNAWREANQNVRLDLSGADLFWAKFGGANLSGANLSRELHRETQEEQGPAQEFYPKRDLGAGDSSTQNRVAALHTGPNGCRHNEESADDVQN